MPSASSDLVLSLLLLIPVSKALVLDLLPLCCLQVLGGGLLPLQNLTKSHVCGSSLSCHPCPKFTVSLSHSCLPHPFQQWSDGPEPGSVGAYWGEPKGHHFWDCVTTARGRFKSPAPWLLFVHSFPMKWACQCCSQVIWTWQKWNLYWHQAVLWVTGGPVERGGISKYTRQHREPKFKSQDEKGPC